MKYWITDTKDPDGIPESVEADTFDEAVSVFAKASCDRKGPKWDRIEVRELVGKSIRNCEIRDYRLVGGFYLSNELSDKSSKRPRGTKAAPVNEIKTWATDEDERCRLFVEEFGDELLESLSTQRGAPVHFNIHQGAVYPAVTVGRNAYVDLSSPIFSAESAFTQNDTEKLLAQLGWLDTEDGRTQIRKRLNSAGAANVEHTTYMVEIVQSVVLAVNASSSEEAAELVEDAIRNPFSLPASADNWQMSGKPNPLPELVQDITAIPHALRLSSLVRYEGVGVSEDEDE